MCLQRFNGVRTLHILIRVIKSRKRGGVGIRKKTWVDCSTSLVFGTPTEPDEEGVEYHILVSGGSGESLDGERVECRHQNIVREEDVIEGS